MMTYSKRIAGLSILAAMSLHSAASATAMPFDVRYESETAGKQTTSATFSTGGVETFDGLTTGSGKTYATDFGTSGAISGTYSNLRVNGADQYGGAGGTGNYAVTYSTTGYTLDLSSAIAGGVNYFGYWLSALDKGNSVSFYSNNSLLFTFDSRDALAAVGNNSTYKGNPNSAFAGKNTGEAYVFLNFFYDGGSFDRIVFAENPQVGGYESDNHTVGHFTSKGTGTELPLTYSSSAVPEPASWSMMLMGFGLLGAMLRRKHPAMAVNRI